MIASPAARDATGSLRVVAAHDGARTVIETLRRDGHATSSRPFAEPNGAARLVVSQLGPGYVRGDRFTCDVRVGARADLTLAAQAASRALGSGGVSDLETRLDLARDARLFVAGEPLIAYDGAEHRSRTVATLAPGATFAWLDCIAPYGDFVRVATTLRVTFDGRLAVHDALRLTPALLAESLGSAYYLRAGIDDVRTAALVATADAAANACANGAGVTVGVGTPAAGGVALRARGRSVRAVRAVLYEILMRLRASDATAGDDGRR